MAYRPGALSGQRCRAEGRVVVSVVVVGSARRVFVPIRCVSVSRRVQLVAADRGGFAITTVGGYAGHRAAHEVPVLWRFHRGITASVTWIARRQSPTPAGRDLRSPAAALPLYALGFGRVVLGAFVILITVRAIFIHANVRMNFGPVRWLIATLSSDHWHHAREPRAYNTNYAGEFPILDALFGTLYLPADRWPGTRYSSTNPSGRLSRSSAWPLRTRCASDSNAARTTSVEGGVTAPLVA